MNRQIFLGIFLIIIGAIGFIVGAVTHHLTDSTPALIGYILPMALGVIMILIDRLSNK